MTKKPNIRTADLDQYQQKSLKELEGVIATLSANELQDLATRKKLRAAHQALRERQRKVKAAAMKFEATNDHHVLLFDSTNGFVKMAGNSVLFYTLTIANRLRRRYKIQPDTDDYSKSAEGIVAIKSRERLEEQLEMLEIKQDEAQVEAAWPELHFYKLTKVYTTAQIEQLHDRSKQELERIAEIIMPESPLPLLYRDILELNQLIYHACKGVSERFARETLAELMMVQADEILQNYLNYANLRVRASMTQKELQNAIAAVGRKVSARIPQAATQNLFNMLINARQLRNRMANMENLRLIHHRQLGQILEKLVEIEHAAEREYLKRCRELERKSGDEV